jgi:hypothetical protein
VFVKGALNGRIGELQDQKRRTFANEALRQSFLDSAIKVLEAELQANEGEGDL